MLSRRQLLCFSALITFYGPLISLKVLALSDDSNNNSSYPLTVAILKKAYRAEITAGKHYDGYCLKALSDNHVNIAYLFKILSTSEKIHAEKLPEINFFYELNDNQHRNIRQCSRYKN